VTSRLKKVSLAIQQQLAQIFQNEVSDPRLSLVSVTEVQVSPNLRSAYVYYHVIGLSDEVQIQEVQSVVSRASGFFRAELAHRIKLKFLPTLHFRYDDLNLKSEKMDRLINVAIGKNINGGSNS
jgi:ribosome-binding factor A